MATASLQPTAMSSLILLLVIFSLSPAVTLSQDDPNPTIAQCATRLLPLAPCAAFVQGSTPSPSQSCCDNLKQLYTQQHHCLSMLLNNTTLSAFPINSSLALQLPQLCSLQLDTSVCSPGVNGSTSPDSQVSFGSRDTNSTANSTAAASPMFQTVPRSNNNTVGHGLGRSVGNNLKSSTGGDFAVLVMVAALITNFLLT